MPDSPRHPLADILVTYAAIPDRGQWDADNRIMRLRDDLPPPAARSSLAHEIVHAVRGIPRRKVPPLITAIDEAGTEARAARLLISVADIVTVALSGATVPEAAERLHVDVRLLHARLRDLDEVEMAFIEAATEAA